MPPGKKEELRRRMEQMHVFEKDIQETFVRSSGPGGQNINKVSTCVVLYHRPTGIQVKCQTQRSQALNRHQARCLLLEKIEEQRKQAQWEIEQERQKAKRQKRKRPKALKEAMEQQKRHRSEKKALRQRIRINKFDQYF